MILVWYIRISVISLKKYRIIGYDYAMKWVLMDRFDEIIDGLQTAEPIIKNKTTQQLLLTTLMW